MVFYTCSGCGESLKKNKVEKHVYTCRGCEYLTCIDCGKDFYGDDYKEHNQCITENQKYSAKGTEFKPNKGDVKQQKWMQNIENAASSNSGLSKKAKELMSNLSNYDNIPRKRAKFLNFLKNSLRIYDTKLGEEVWEVFSAGNKKESPEKTETKDLEDSKKGDKEDSDNLKTDVKAPEKENIVDNVASQKEVLKKAKKHAVNKDSDEKPSKKKKKNKVLEKKSAEADSEEVIEAADTSNNKGQTTPIEGSCKSGKKDKKKRKIQDAKATNSEEPSDKNQKNVGGEERVNGENNDGGVLKIIDAENGVKKSKKKKKAKDGNSPDDENTQNGGVGGNNENEVVSKLVLNDDKSIKTQKLKVKKNRKGTNQESEMTQNGGGTNTTDAEPVSTKKKKKRKNTEDNGMVQTNAESVVVEVAPNDSISRPKKKKKRKSTNEGNGIVQNGGEVKNSSVTTLVQNEGAISESNENKVCGKDDAVDKLVHDVDNISKTKKKKNRKKKIAGEPV